MSLILPLSLLLGAILGVSAHRAGLCAVKAVAEVMTSGRGWILWSFLKASLWVIGLTAIASMLTDGIVLRHWPIGLIGVLGGLIFGLGAGANGACSFSTLVRLAEGHVVMLFTLAGWPIGMAGVHLLWRDLHQTPVLAQSIPVWFLFFLGPWMLWEVLNILRRLRAEGWGQLRAAHWPLSLSIALLAIANFGILSLGTKWSFTSTMICAVRAAPLTGCANGAVLWLISAAAILGMAGSAALRGSFRIRRVRAKAALRHGMAGVAMGVGAALIPGGNDGLILFGLPSLSPHALPSWGAIILGVTLALVLMRAMGRKMPAIRCESDICRSSL
ncbi:YeeE/YedE thiosulfate transporter family protein [Roseovarius sp. ZX-A-9]|uniref:YeeE/YedE thiosulfate transporter family protein n=1 Tax=Roseovarius sp. ZX-A-9 TaxID=3014783 RepID=UPI00232BF555|nr:YeeE/YedE thiosulfate transporter family protein [Roseovarius sp. ZX-A-9]